jgi:hypothetical protein
MTYVIVPTKYGVLNVEVPQFDRWGQELRGADFHIGAVNVQAHEKDGGIGNANGLAYPDEFDYPEDRKFITVPNRSIEWWPYAGITQRTKLGADFPVKPVDNVDGKKKLGTFSSTYSFEGQIFDAAITEAFLSGIFISLTQEEKDLINDAFLYRWERINKIRQLKELENTIRNDTRSEYGELGKRYTTLFPAETDANFGPPHSTYLDIKLY